MNSPVACESNYLSYLPPLKPRKAGPNLLVSLLLDDDAVTITVTVTILCRGVTGTRDVKDEGTVETGRIQIIIKKFNFFFSMVRIACDS